MKILLLLVVFGTFSCTYDVLPEENACSDIPELVLVSTEDTECGNNLGEIVVEANGVEGAPFKFRLNGENENITGRFENLPAATYQVEVLTIDGCSNTLSVEIKNQSGLNISVQTVESDCSNNTGEITISTEGGQPPYSFSLNNTDFQTEASFKTLASGSYTVFAKDATGCSVSQSAEISSAVSFSTVQAIIQTNCVTASCHGGNVNPDFIQAANISGSAGRIKSRTGGKTMPPSSSGMSLTDQEIDLIACWVDSGAQQ